MVDFTVDLGGPQRGQVTVKQKPVDTSKANKFNAKADLLKTIFSSIPTREDRAKIAEEKGLANYQQQLLKLGQAVEQKRMSASAARTRARALHSEFISNNPSLTEKATTLHSKTLSSAGLGKAIGRADVIGEAEDKLLGEAVEAGFIYSSMSPEQQQEGYHQYMKFKLAQQSMEIEKERLGLESSKVGLSKSQIELSNARNKQVALKHLDEVAEGVRSQIRFSLNDIRERLASGQITQEAAVQEARDRKALMASEVNNLARAAGNENIKSVTGPIDMMFDTAIDEFSGKLKTDIAKTRLDFYETGIQSKMLEDPKMQTLYGIGKMLPNADMATIQPHIDMAVDFMKTNSFDTSKTPYNLWDINKSPDQGARERKAAVGIIKSNINKSGSVDSSDKEVHTEQVNNNIMNLLRSVDIYEKAIESPKEFNQIVDFIASPEYIKWTSENPVDQETAMKAAEVLKIRYEQEALPAIEQMWLQPQFGGEDWKSLQDNIANNISMQDMIEVEFNPEGIKFVAKTDDRRIGIAATHMNKQISPVVNKLIRSAAHLEGHTNYKEVFEKNFSKIFDNKNDLKGEKGIEEVLGKVGEDVSPETKPVLDLIGKAEGTDKGDGYNETLGYGKFTDGDVNLTSMTIDEVIKLQGSILKHPENDTNSSAVGRYQIVRKTLKMLKDKLDLDGSELFDEGMQDRLAEALLEMRGLSKYRSGKMSEEEFLEQLAQEWASLPTSSGSSYYKDHSIRTSVDEVIKSLRG